MTLLFERRSPVARPATTFVDELESFGSNAALVDHDGRCISYDELVARISEFVDALGRTRRLVFVEAANSVDAVAAYLACLKARHPVYLFNSRDREKLDPLIDRYWPNAIITAENTDVAWLHYGTRDLHDELCVLLSTSGSTGSPKLVKLSRRNLDSNARSIATYLSLDASDKAITTLPFNYSYGLSVVNSHLTRGGTLVLTDYSVTDAGFWETFRRTGATSFAGVPYTFESLHRSRFSFDDLETLRYATQAGGRLDPQLAAHFARLAASQGWQFIVMYGQTEAAARIAYLPPDRAIEHPECIGVPVPGGRILLLDDEGEEIAGCDRPGQLAYVGPNVMMGYAEQPGDLATDTPPRRLLTGDIACRNQAGLIYIIGRVSRFVKPFGLRVNLDDLESQLQAAVPGTRCAGDDQRIVVAVESGCHDAAKPAVRRLANTVGLPEFVFQIVVLDEVPRLPNGKVDYAQILTLGSAPRPRPAPPRFDPVAALRVVFSRRFAREYTHEFARLLGVRARTWKGIAHIYSTLLDSAEVSDLDTFKTLAGDSLSYVQVTAALTDYVGALPANWPELSVRELELARLARHASTV